MGYSQSQRPRVAPEDPDMVPLGTTEPPEPRDISLADVGKGAWSNLGPSAKQAFIDDPIHLITHLPEVARTIRDIPVGIGEKLGILDQGGEAADKVDAIGRFYKDRYYGWNRIKDTFAKDPVGAALDALTVASLGRAALLRAPGAFGEISRAADKAAKQTIKTVASDTVGGVTKVGGQTVRDLYDTAAQGGRPERKAVWGAMDGEVPPRKTLNAVRDSVGVIRRDIPHRLGMTDVLNDTKALDFTKVEGAFADASAINGGSARFAEEAASIRKTMGDAIERWKSDPTAAAAFELRKELGKIADGTAPGTAAREAASDVYRNVSEAIFETVPQKYVKTVAAIEETSKQLKDIDALVRSSADLKPGEIERTLRELQARLVHQVDAGFGNPNILAQYLTEAGAPNLMGLLAGQIIHNAPKQRGLSRRLGEAIWATAKSAPDMSAMSLLGAISQVGASVAPIFPNYVGKGAYVAGRVSNYPLAKVGLPPYQLGRIQEHLDDQ